MNIILVAGANAQGADDHAGLAPLGARRRCAARRLRWSFTFAFNFVTLKWAAATQHPWLQAMVLADQREEAARAQERVQGHLNAMAMRLGELQAQMLRLDGLGERLAKTAGLKPQELPSLAAGHRPGRGGAESSLPSRNLSVGEFARPGRPARAADGRRAPTSCRVLEALLVHDSRQPQVPADAAIRSSTAGTRRTSATASTRSPGQQSLHEGIDFLAEAGTPIVAAASGKVVFAEWHPAIW